MKWRSVTKHQPVPSKTVRKHGTKAPARKNEQKHSFKAAWGAKAVGEKHMTTSCPSAACVRENCVHNLQKQTESQERLFEFSHARNGVIFFLKLFDLLVFMCGVCVFVNWWVCGQCFTFPTPVCVCVCVCMCAGRHTIPSPHHSLLQKSTITQSHQHVASLSLSPPPVPSISLLTISQLLLSARETEYLLVCFGFT